MGGREDYLGRCSARLGAKCPRIFNAQQLRREFAALAWDWEEGETTSGGLLRAHHGARQQPWHPRRRDHRCRSGPQDVAGHRQVPLAGAISIENLLDINTISIEAGCSFEEIRPIRTGGDTDKGLFVFKNFQVDERGTDWNYFSSDFCGINPPHSCSIHLEFIHSRTSPKRERARQRQQRRTRWRRASKGGR